MNRILRQTTILLLSLTVPVWAESYTIDQFLDRVETHSKELKLAEQELQMARATKREAVSGALPRLAAEASYTRNLTDTYMYADLGGLTGDDAAGEAKLRINKDNEYGLNVVLSQTLFNGAVYNAIRAANQYQKLTDFIYDASYQQVMTYARTAFYQSLLLEKVWEVTESSEQNAYENYLDVKKAYDHGLVSEFQLLQAEVRYKDVVPQTTEAERNYQISLLSLKNLAGIPTDEDLILDGSLDDYPQMPQLMNLESILDRRPDYNALVWEEKLRRTGVKAEKANYLPTLTGSLIYAFSAQSDEWDFANDNNTVMVGLNLSIPIFTGGATRARVQQAQIELDKTRITIDRTRDDIEKEISSIRLVLEEANRRILSAQATLNAAEKAFSIASATAQSGLTTQLELKDSRVMLDQATVGYYSAIFEYLAAYFDWQRSTGSMESPRTS